MKNKMPYRFFVITFLWSWIIWGVAIILGQESSQNIFNITSGIIAPLMLMGAFGPVIGAFVSIRSIDGKGAIKQFIKSFLSVNFGRKVWLSIFLVFGISTFIAWIIPEFWGEDRVSMYLPSVFVFPPYLLLMIFFGGGQEEIGWRGYILPYLEKKYGLIFGSLILGIVWAVWHIPLWFIAGSSQTYMNFLVFMFMTIGYSYFFSWVIHASGNRLLSGLLAHGAANAFIPLFPVIIFEHGANQIRFWIYGVLILLMGIFVVGMRVYKNKKINVRV